MLMGEIEVYFILAQNQKSLAHFFIEFSYHLVVRVFFTYSGYNLFDMCNLQISFNVMFSQSVIFF